MAARDGLANDFLGLIEVVGEVVGVDAKVVRAIGDVIGVAILLEEKHLRAGFDAIDAVVSGDGDALFQIIDAGRGEMLFDDWRDDDVGHGGVGGLEDDGRGTGDDDSGWQRVQEWNGSGRGGMIVVDEDGEREDAEADDEDGDEEPAQPIAVVKVVEGVGEWTVVSGCRSFCWRRIGLAVSGCGDFCRRRIVGDDG